MDFVCVYGCFQKNRDGWFIMENPINIINMDDLGVALFSETPIYTCEVCTSFSNRSWCSRRGVHGAQPLLNPQVLRLAVGKWRMDGHGKTANLHLGGGNSFFF